jgi:hypothetical protein
MDRTDWFLAIITFFVASIAVDTITGPPELETLVVAVALLYMYGFPVFVVGHYIKKWVHEDSTSINDDFRYAEWPIEGTGESVFVGVLAGRQGEPIPVRYDREEHVFFGVELNEDSERLRRLPDREWDLDSAESVGEGIERLGEEIGWDSLSAVGEAYLEAGQS